MSKERELLKTILAYMAAEYLVMTEFEMITQIEETIEEIQELLAQPDRRPLSDLRIVAANRNEYFEWGVRFAEKAHGIGGGE